MLIVFHSSGRNLPLLVFDSLHEIVYREHVFSHLRSRHPYTQIGIHITTQINIPHSCDGRKLIEKHIACVGHLLTKRDSAIGGEHEPEYGLILRITLANRGWI